MAIRYPDIVQAPAERRRLAYTAKDTILYALGVGMGTDPTDAHELAFVYEEGLQALPTLVTALALAAQRVGEALPAEAPPAQWRPSTTNRLLRVHGAQKVEFHRPIPPADGATIEHRIVGAIDKGLDKGALVIGETLWRDGGGGLAATLTTTSFCRGDGGFGGPSHSPPPHRLPDREPDLSLDLPTRPDLALLFRLSGDLNPIHVDPATAQRAGFPRPILHGLASFGMAFRALLRSYADFDTGAVASLEARFSAPVLPGDTLTFDLWKDGAEVSFQARVASRGVIALKHGKAMLC